MVVMWSMVVVMRYGVSGALLDGALLDWTLLDGTLLDGTLLNGTLLEGTLLDGALLHGACCLCLIRSCLVCVHGVRIGDSRIGSHGCGIRCVPGMAGLRCSMKCLRLLCEGLSRLRLRLCLRSKCLEVWLCCLCGLWHTLWLLLTVVSSIRRILISMILSDGTPGATARCFHRLVLVQDP